jgi:hypothetical protein
MAPISRRALAGVALGGLVLAHARSASAADAPAAGPLRKDLLPLARFIGKWIGEGDGEPGHSTLERTYEPTLGGKFLMVHHQSNYAPQPKNPKGETHNDVGFISFDKARKVAVLRQFHVEGFVNQFTAPATTLVAQTIVFDSEAIENIPAGYKARETYKWSGADAFEDVFEIAEPGKDYSVYSHNRFKRG